MLVPLRPWLHPPFRLPAAAWAQLDRELARPADNVDWVGLHDVDVEVSDSIQAELRSLPGSAAARLGALSPARRAWAITAEADLVVGGEGVEGWLLKYAPPDGPLAPEEVVARYELFGEDAMAQRLRRALVIFREVGRAGMFGAAARGRIRGLDALVANPHGDASVGRLRYARLYREEFFLGRH